MPIRKKEGTMQRLPIALSLGLLAGTLPWHSAQGAPSYPCLIEPSKVVNASTAVEGILALVAVEKGDVVKEGQVVAALDASVESAVLEQAKARLTMTAGLRAREEEYRLAKARYGRAKSLSANNHIPPDELDELRSTQVVAELRLLEEKEQRLVNEIEVRRVQAQYDLRFIKSPIDGVVVERYLSAGEFAQAQPIVKLARLDPVNVEVVLPSARFGDIREGMRGEVRAVSLGERVLTGTVTVVERVVDAGSDTFSVRLQVANPDFSIPAGLECEAQVLPASGQEAS